MNQTGFEEFIDYFISPVLAIIVKYGFQLGNELACINLC